MTVEAMSVMVTVKAYPQPSRTYGETVCVAGVRIDVPAPAWIRLYPVAYRDLAFTDRFKKYQVLEVRAFRSGSDTRPESYKPVLTTARLGELIGSADAWRRRWAYLDALAGATTACRIYKSQNKHAAAASLGLIKPRRVLDLEIVPNEAFSHEKQLLATRAAAGTLFTAERVALEPAPYRLRYRYTCMERGCKGHLQTLVDWEAGQAARRWRNEGASECDLPALLRHTFLEEMCGPTRDPYFFLGNQHQHRNSFLVLGVFWPPIKSRPDPTLFD